MEADLYRAIQLQSLLTQELSRNAPAPATLEPAAAASHVKTQAETAPSALPELPDGCEDALQHIYSERPDLARCRSDLAHGLMTLSVSQLSLSDTSYESLRADPDQISFACEVLQNRVVHEPLLQPNFRDVGQDRIQTMIHSAVRQCVYYSEQPEPLFLKKLLHIHADMDIR